MNRRLIVGALTMALCVSTEAVTKVQLWFDTEDYTYEPSNDAIRDIANILTEEGVRGHFNIVGYLAKFIRDNHRQDVIDALKPHLVGTQTLYHSRHPTICEYTDIADYDEAYRLCMEQEAECARLVKSVFGRDHLEFAVMPGCSSSYVALDVYADLGIPVAGGVTAMGDDRRGEFWYQNMRQVLYNSHIQLELLRERDAARRPVYNPKDLEARLNACTNCERIVVYMHPDLAIKAQHWDIENFLKGNLTPFGQWNKPALVPKAETQIFYKRLRAFVRQVKNDPRFAFETCTDPSPAQAPRVAIRREDVPAIRAALLKSFGPIEKPASWCVADCFQAAVKFLCGETVHMPGKVYGFLEKPESVAAPVTVKTADLKVAARKIVFKRHLPTSYDVGGIRLGPAEFLLAALEAIETGRETVTVQPRDPQGDMAVRMPILAAFTHVRNWPIYPDDFKDTYLSNRLRWQYWTFRY